MNRRPSKALESMPNVSGSVAIAAVAAVVMVPVGTSSPEVLKVYGCVTIRFIVTVAS